jgi:YD repeat-containing protein
MHACSLTLGPVSGTQILCPPLFECLIIMERLQIYNRKRNEPTGSYDLNGNRAIRDYTYNKIGQMTEQVDATCKKLKTSYDATGKVTEVRDRDYKPITSCVYDDRGFRLKKTTPLAKGGNMETPYVRDASGNVWQYL